jgi:simple sugar transport system ATP-binding protein
MSERRLSATVEPGATPAGLHLLEMRGIRKTFGPVVALDGVDFEVGAREVHGLLGGNGAGKTTLMNVLYGLYRPDAGSVHLDGRQVTIRAPRDAIAAGIGMVHQNFLQVDSYTVAENIVLGTRQPTFPVLDLSAAKARIAELSERFGLAVDPDVRVENLSVGVRQRVEILKALFRGARLLVLDEPTTNLTPQEVDALFGSLRAIVEGGMSVIFITHKIRETMAVCDRMTIMRDGRRIATLAREETSARQLAAAMVGEAAEREPVVAVVGEAATVADRQGEAPGVPEDAPRRIVVEGLSAHNDHGVRAVHDCSFEIRAGEILGVAGVAGNGQVELAESLAGVRPAVAGRVLLDGVDMVGRPTAAWLEAGVAYVPEDRHRDGILPTLSIAENLILGAQRSRRFRRGRFIDPGAAGAVAAVAMSTYEIKASGAATAAGTLSGGNMQRVILARTFSRRPGLLILHNPTRGLDIRSTEFVYDRVREATQAGAAVLLLSEDLDELTLLADRILVLYRGRIAGERRRGGYDQYELGRLMAGVEADT